MATPPSLLASSIGLVLVVSACLPPGPPDVGPDAVPSTSSDASAGVDAFNRALLDATRRMDDAAVLALWADDGVSLQSAIAAFLWRVHAELPYAKMRSFEMRCSGLVVAKDTASEYCEEHQVVDPGLGKDPFDGVGRMLFVLHRGSGREMAGHPRDVAARKDARAVDGERERAAGPRRRRARE